MRKITLAEAKKSLGHYLNLAAAGEEIAIVSGAGLISLRKLEEAAVEPGGATGEQKAKSEDWPEFPTFEGGPADGALNHDHHLYDEPRRKLRRTASR
jgi:hypothetical protein